MKRFVFNLSIALGALAVGISSVWLRCLFPSVVPQSASFVTHPVIHQVSGNVLVNFQGIYETKECSASFELVNDTDQPIIYAGYTNRSFKVQENFCKLAVRQADSIVSEGDIDYCKYAFVRNLQTVLPGEKTYVSVTKWDVKTLLKLESEKPEITTQVGFEVFTGQDRTRQIIWSNELTFPGWE